jgi:hypothetical protein
MLRNAYRIGLLGAAAAAILVVALAGCGGGDPASSPSSQTGEKATAASGMRTVRVFDHEPAPSPSVANLHAGLEKGALPDGPVLATVLTDEDCAPDRQGISHCRNRVRLAGGGIAVLRHPHDMHQVPCLAPGEKVLLRRA